MPPLGENIQITLVILVGLFALQTAYPEVNTLANSQLLVSGWQVFAEGRVWTVLTYAFWHAGYGHLLANGVTLFFFGGYVEERWSSAEFWAFCLVCAVGSGLTIVLWQVGQAVAFVALTGTVDQFWTVLNAISRTTLGYSGVVTGLLAAFAYYTWNKDFQLLIVPMTGKWLFFLVIGLDVIRVCGGANVSLSGHLGGLVCGFLATHYWLSGNTSPFGSSEPEATALDHELLEDAEAARDRGDWEEVYRVCHQLRSTGTPLPSDMQQDIWELLAIAATKLGKHDEAETYFERAPETRAVEEARRQRPSADDDG